MLQGTGQSQRFLTVLQCLVWIAQIPEHLREPDEAEHRTQEAIEAVLLRLVESFTLLQVFTRREQLTEVEHGIAQDKVRPCQHYGILALLGQRQGLLPQLLCWLEFAPRII